MEGVKANASSPAPEMRMMPDQRLSQRSLASGVILRTSRQNLLMAGSTMTKRAIRLRVLRVMTYAACSLSVVLSARLHLGQNDELGEGG